VRAAYTEMRETHESAKPIAIKNHGGQGRGI